MILYLVRHAEALEKSENVTDEWRHLTEKGRKEALQVAKYIPGLGSKPRLILTSPLTRAVQTAEIAAGWACRKNRVEVSPLLMPGQDPAAVADYVAALDGPGRVMLVGHEPQLGTLAALLLGLKEPVLLKKGACLALKPGKDGGSAEFLWYLRPGRKPVTAIKKAFKGA
jgi:phosphohistidine phosphatase